jgi:hypothetical protein
MEVGILQAIEIPTLVRDTLDLWSHSRRKNW